MNKLSWADPPINFFKKEIQPGSRTHRLLLALERAPNNILNTFELNQESVDTGGGESLSKALKHYWIERIGKGEYKLTSLGNYVLEAIQRYLKENEIGIYEKSNVFTKGDIFEVISPFKANAISSRSQTIVLRTGDILELQSYFFEYSRDEQYSLKVVSLGQYIKIDKEDFERLVKKNVLQKQANETWDVTDNQFREPEEMNFSKPYDDGELKRTNPPRYDKRKDWYQILNEKAKDTDISGRYEQTSLTSGASWRQILAFDENLGVPPGFIPTNEGMRTPEDIFDALDYGSYAANRDYDRTIDPYSKEPNPDYDFEKSRLRWRNFWINHGGWSDRKLDIFERRYYNETGGK